MMPHRYIAIRSTADRVVAAALVVATAPLLAAVAIGVRLRMGPPVLFRQVRVGKSGATFEILKFRTMVKGAEALGGGGTPPHLDLVPPFGRALRASSLDELPQLWNIVRGEMAFVGPRPMLPSQHERCTERQQGRTAVPPGVTGLAQVRYRHAARWSTRIEADLDYVAAAGPRLDAAILAATVRAVLSRRGVIDDVTDDDDDLGDASSAVGGEHLSETER